MIIGLSVATVNISFAADLTPYKNGTVTGGVIVNGTEPNPFPSASDSNKAFAEFSQVLPNNATIKYVGLFVNLYSGSANNTYGANNTITVDNGHGTIFIRNNILQHPPGVEYIPNSNLYQFDDHITLQYSDYQLYYDITNLFYNINSGTIYVTVNSTQIPGLNFDARVKMIALIIAYDDNDNETLPVHYWVNSGQNWVNGNNSGYSVFDTANIDYDVSDANLYNFALSTADGKYTFNNEILDSSSNLTSLGTYYKFHSWNVKPYITNQSNHVKYTNTGNGSYSSFKNVLSVLTITEEVPVQIPKIEPISTTLTLNSSIVNQGNITIINAILKDSNGVNLANQQIKLSINNKLYTATTNSNGLAIFTITGLPTGSISALASYDGDSTNLKSSAFHTVTVTLPSKDFSLNNNSSATKLPTTTKTKADLTISSIKRYGNNYIVTIKNNGQTKSSSTKVKIFFKIGSKTYYKVANVKSINGGKTSKVIVKFYPYVYHKKYQKTVQVNYNKKAIESNYKNNVQKFRA
jgi:hypothetical protein